MNANNSFTKQSSKKIYSFKSRLPYSIIKTTDFVVVDKQIAICSFDNVGKDYTNVLFLDMHISISS